MNPRREIVVAGAHRRCERCGTLFLRRDGIRIDVVHGEEMAIVRKGGVWICSDCEGKPKTELNPGVVLGRFPRK